MKELEIIREKVGKHNAALVAVSKTKPIAAIKELYDQGQRIFGENRVPEMIEKCDNLPDDIEWHMIGHLQRKKVKHIIPFVSMIHAVDSVRLIEEINKRAAEQERVVNVLLQFHIAKEESKFGLSMSEAKEILDANDFAPFQNINIAGVMGMATFTDDQDQVRSEFKSLKSIFDQIKSDYFPNQDSFKEISMGMSGDYEIALEEGSTMIRIGSLLFGARD